MTQSEESITLVDFNGILSIFLITLYINISTQNIL